MLRNNRSRQRDPKLMAQVDVLVLLNIINIASNFGMDKISKKTPTRTLAFGRPIQSRRGHTGRARAL